MQFGLNRSKLEGHGLYALAKCQHGTNFNKIYDLYQTVLTTEPIYHHSSCINNEIFFNVILWLQFTRSAAALLDNLIAYGPIFIPIYSGASQTSLNESYLILFY